MPLLEAEVLVALSAIVSSAPTANVVFGIVTKLEVGGLELGLEVSIKLGLGAKEEKTGTEELLLSSMSPVPSPTGSSMDTITISDTSVGDTSVNCSNPTCSLSFPR